MIISDEFKFVYIDVPKTGSVSFERVFRENFSGKQVYPTHNKNLAKHCREIPEYAKDYTTVVSVRNPYTRAVSLYSYHLRVIGKTSAEYSFENFLDMIINNQEKYEKDNYLMYLSIHRYLSPILLNESTHFIQLEHAETQINDLPFVSKSIEMPHRNGATEKNNIEFSDTVIAKIKIWAGRDFELGGYDENITSFS